MFRDFDSELGDVPEGADAGALGDEIELNRILDKVMSWGLSCHSVIGMWQGLCRVDTTNDRGCCQLGTAVFLDRTPVEAGVRSTGSL